MLLIAHCLLTFLSLGAVVVAVRCVGRCEEETKKPRRRVLHGAN